jgi:hypothetical protein
MKFILVNHRTPLRNSLCSECSQSLGPGYLKAVSTQRQYCDYDCYRRYEARSPLTQWFTAPYVAPFEIMTSFAAASCSYSGVLAEAAFRVGEMVTAELSMGGRRRRT